MGDAISEVLPNAIGIAISPVPIIAVILVLSSSRARVNGVAFLLGSVVGVAVVSVAVYLLADASDVASDEDASDVVYWIKVVLGVLLVLAAVRGWRKEPGPDEPASESKWLASIDTLTPVKAFGLAVLLAALNPKNLALSAAAGANLAQAGVSDGDAAVGLAVFAGVACLSIAVPVVAYLAGGDDSAQMLDGWKTWLSDHKAAVMAVLFLVFGAVLFSQGLSGLTG